MFESRQIFICLLLGTILYCNANPAKETKGDAKAKVEKLSTRNLVFIFFFVSLFE